MGVLLRQTRKSTWSGDPPDEQRRQLALETFRRTEEDTDGLSVFEVVDARERELVIAAIACARASDAPIDFLEVSREFLEQYGTIAPTPGTTPLPAANALHRSLNWDRETLERLAMDLFERQQAAVRTKSADVRAAVSKLGPDDVEGERARTFVMRQREKTGALPPHRRG